MRVDLPECKRCCCCIPLRYGLIAWGYFQLAVTIFALACVCDSFRTTLHNQTPFVAITAILLAIVLILDIILSAILIVGCHRKNYKIIKINYYVGLVLLTLLFGFISLHIGVILYVMFVYSNTMFIGIVYFYGMIDVCIQFLNIVLHTYVLLLVRSEFIKLKNGHQFRFVNNAAEAECTMDLEQQSMTMKEESTKDTVNREEIKK